jgi:hypothetical protein
VLTIIVFTHSCPSAEFISDVKLERSGQLVSHMGRPVFSKVKCNFYKKMKGKWHVCSVCFKYQVHYCVILGDAYQIT